MIIDPIFHGKTGTEEKVCKGKNLSAGMASIYNKI